MKNIDKLKLIFEKGSGFMIPPPVLNPSDWAEQNLILTDGPNAGQKMRLFSFQKQMLDAITEGKKKIVFKTSAQVAKTTLLNATMFYKMVHSGHNIGALQSTTRELNQWIAGKVKPAIAASPVVAELVTDKNDRDAVNNMSQIQLRNGTFLYLMSLTSPSHLRGKTLATALLDEIDAAAESDEGDPVLLAEQRTTTFGDEALVILSSTPTTKEGAISKHFEQSDKRFFWVSCPHCQHKQIMKWDNVKFEWVHREGKKTPDPVSAKYCCSECSQPWTEGDRLRAVAGGQFIASNPGANSIGFHISRLYSPLSTIKQCVQDYADAYNSFSLGTWYNTCLGEMYDDLNADIEIDQLEKLKSDSVSVTNIPDDVLFLVAGGDQQKDRLENTLLGIAEKTIYVLDHRSFGDFDCERRDSPAYTELINFLKADFRTVSGDKVPMLWANLDSSNGKATTTVYANCNRWNKLHAIKGASAADAPMIPQKVSKVGGQEVYILGVNNAKTVAREMIARNLKGDAPTKLVISSSVPDDYSEQVLSEELKRVGNTVRWTLKKGKERNEGLDCFGYGLCARALVLKSAKWEQLKAFKQRLNAVTDKTNPDVHPEHNPAENPVQKESRPISKPTRRSPVSRPRKKSGWISGF